MLRLALFAAAAWIAGDLGFATLRPEYGTALIWPVTGVALVWAATGSRRTWPVDAVVLVAVSVAALRLADATWGQGVMAGLQTVVQAAVYLVVVRRLAPDVWSGGGTRPMVRLGDLGAFTVSVLVAALVATAVRSLGLGLIPRPELTDNALVWVRNFCGMFTIGALALLCAPLLERGGGATGWRRRATRWWGRPPARAAEVVLVTGLSLLLFAAVFWQREAIPVSFTLMLPMLWAGLRTRPPYAAWLSAALGTLVIVLTLDSRGIFAAETDPRVGALLAQALVVSTLGFSVAIALIGSERLQASAQARRSARDAAERSTLLTAVLEQIREGIMVVSADGTVTLRNRALGHLPGQGRDPEVRDDEGRPVPPERQPLARALGGEDVVAEHLVLLDADGSDRTLEVSASRLPAEPDAVDQVLVVLRDVTLARQREADLAAFAGVVAHDLNNPLAVVTGWADALDDSFGDGPVDGDEGRMYTSRIRDSAVQMRRFIDDLLAYTVARDQPFHAEDVDLSALVEEVAALRRDSAAPDRRPAITVQPGMRLQGDRVLLRQLLDNLVGNAVKYVAADVVPEVAVSARTLPGPGDVLELRVDDNGVGVPEAQRERIFETFVRAHGSEFSGTGLGLGICRKVVERHAGTIRVEPRPGGGSSFVLTLPGRGAAPGAQQEEQQPAPSTCAGPV